MTELILACDVSDSREGDELIEEVKAEIDVVKIGLEAMTAPARYGGTVADAILTRATEMCGKGVMWDMKIHDVANTMKNAAQNIVKMGARLFTLHASASDAALAAVAEAAGDKAIPLAVTVLTDLDDAQCKVRFLPNNQVFAGRFDHVLVENFARNAWRLGIKGFVCSPLEVELIRQVAPEAYIVTPGIRPVWAVAPDEQKRVTTPAQAKRAGANAIVVGRPIYRPPSGRTRLQAAKDIREELLAA